MKKEIWYSKIVSQTQNILKSSWFYFIEGFIPSEGSKARQVTLNLSQLLQHISIQMISSLWILCVQVAQKQNSTHLLFLHIFLSWIIWFTLQSHRISRLVTVPLVVPVPLHILYMCCTTDTTHVHTCIVLIYRTDVHSFSFTYISSLSLHNLWNVTTTWSPLVLICLHNYYVCF